MKLGKLAPRIDPRTLKLATYIDRLPRVPSSKTWAPKVRGVWPMFKNDMFGDCTFASMAHMIRTWTANARGEALTIEDQEVLDAYSALTGFHPDKPETDQGAVELDVLKSMRKRGLAGRTIGAFASVNPRNRPLMKAASYLFGGVYLGFALPVSAQGREVWDVPAGGLSGDGAPGGWGGHAVSSVAHDAAGIVVATWGALQRVTWRFVDAYCDEAWAIISPDWFNGMRSVSGFDSAALRRDLAMVGKLAG